MKQPLKLFVSIKINENSKDYVSNSSSHANTKTTTNDNNDNNNNNKW